MRVQEDDLRRLIEAKLEKAGLRPEHAARVADVLVYADLRGIHSHGAMRTEYYAERIVKGGMTTDPDMVFEERTPSIGILDGDNGSGHVAAHRGMVEAIRMARESGIAAVGVRRMSHSGAIGYFTEMAAREGLVALSMCQSDPMVVPFGGSENYYGTNPIAFATPADGDRIISFDMATTVQAWGKILDARSRDKQIPDTWAVDSEGAPTTDPHKVSGLLHAAGPKGYGLALMVDVLSGILLGLPFGKHVTSMYEDMRVGRELGQLHIVLNPAFFTDADTFRANVGQAIDELNAIKPAPGFDTVLAPGQNHEGAIEDARANGMDIADSVHEYLTSEDVNRDTYEVADGSGTFA